MHPWVTPEREGFDDECTYGRPDTVSKPSEIFPKTCYLDVNFRWKLKCWEIYVVAGRNQRYRMLHDD